MSILKWYAGGQDIGHPYQHCAAFFEVLNCRYR